MTSTRQLIQVETNAGGSSGVFVSSNPHMDEDILEIGRQHGERAMLVALLDKHIPPSPYEYNMLPFGAYRTEYDTPPLLWKHKCLPFILADRVRRMDALNAEAVDTEAKRRKADGELRKLKREQATRHQTVSAEEKLNSLAALLKAIAGDLRDLEAFQAADQLRYEQGLAMGFEDVGPGEYRITKRQGSE